MPRFDKKINGHVISHSPRTPDTNQYFSAICTSVRGRLQNLEGRDNRTLATLKCLKDYCFHTGGFLFFRKTNTNVFSSIKKLKDTFKAYEGTVKIVLCENAPMGTANRVGDI